MIFKGSFETFSFDGTWKSFHTADETPPPRAHIITFSGNMFYHSSSYFERQSVLFFQDVLLCAELNVNVLFGLGFRSPPKAEPGHLWRN